MFPLFFIVFVFMGVSWGEDPTDGFEELPLTGKILELHKPFDLPACARYVFSNDTHKFWTLRTDKPAWKHPGNPRSEIRIRGYEYTAGTWQFEGTGYIPNGTTGVCIFQVFGQVGVHPTILMLKFYDCKLCIYTRTWPIARNLCDRPFRLNVIHDADAGIIYIYMNGTRIKQVNNRKHALHWHQFGAYAQESDFSYYMEVRWTGVKFLKKTQRQLK